MFSVQCSRFLFRHSTTVAENRAGQRPFRQREGVAGPFCAFVGEKSLTRAFRPAESSTMDKSLHRQHGGSASSREWGQRRFHHRSTTDSDGCLLLRR
jgi:hypothetical protein